MTSTFLKTSLIAACAAAGLTSVAASAQETPALAEPGPQKQLEAAKAELAKYRANPAGYFQMPASGVAMPCAAAENGIKAAVGIVDWDKDPDMKRAMAKATRNSGMAKGAMSAPAYKDVKLVVVKAQCEGEAAAGDFDAWVDYVMVNDSAQFTSFNPYLVHVSGRFAAGEARPVYAFNARKAGDSSTVWKDPATAAMMAKVPPTKVALQLFQVVEKQGSVAITTMSVGGKPSITTMVTTVQDGPEKRTLTRMYNEATLTNESRTRNGEAHGAQMSYPYFNKQIGMQIPGGMTCFDEGEMIKTTKCDVE